LLFESALYTVPDSQQALSLLVNNPAFFPFHIPLINTDSVAQNSERIDVIRYGLDDELLKLKA
jgi:hypothetical protein